MRGAPRGVGPDAVSRSDPLWDDERLVLVVVASGLVVLTATAALQVLWLVALLLAPLVARWLAAPHPGRGRGGPRGVDGPDDGGGGGGGIRGRGPQPTRPSGVK